MDRGENIRFCSEYNGKSIKRNHLHSCMESGVSGSRRGNGEMKKLLQRRGEGGLDWG